MSLPDFTIKPTPWDDILLGGPTGRIIFQGQPQNQPVFPESWRTGLAATLRQQGFVYVSGDCPADDLDTKLLFEHCGFGFVYQTITCLLRLTPDLPLRGDVPGLVPAEPDQVDPAEVAALCGRTLRHGRFCEDRAVSHLAARRNGNFIADLHGRPDVHRIFTRAPDGRLNGYAYLPIEGSTVDLMLMGIDEAAAPAGGGRLFWEHCLAAVRDLGLARRVRTRVPAANLGVINIYAALGFSFVAPAYEFRLLPSGSIRQMTSQPPT
jgi:GNAT superfamily N-acetyltransferase